MSQKVAPKRRNKEKTRQTLLLVATEMFAKQGFESTTTKQIAKKADVNEVMIARYFKNKAGLLEAIMVELIESAKAHSGARPIADTLEEELTFLMREKCSAYIVQRDVHKISLSRILIDPKLSIQVHKHVYPIAEETIAKRLEGFKANGQIHAGHDIAMLARMVQMECVGLLTMMCVAKQVDRDAVLLTVDTFAPILAQGFRREPTKALQTGSPRYPK